MCVVAYVSGHGFGHAARETEVLRHLPASIPLIVKTRSAEWFWRAELPRPFEFVSEAFDVGCVQHDSIAIDVPATYAAWANIDARNRAVYADEVAYLKRVGARVVVSDVPALPLAVAADADIPGLCITNFTWADIYAGFVDEEPRFAPVVEEMTRQYQCATVCLDADLALPMPYWNRREFVGLIARPGSRRRDALLALLPPPARQRRLALIYLGNWGYPLPYKDLETMTDWQFLSYEPPPEPVANWTTLRRDADWPHPDLVASVDLVVSKPGYGMVAECLSLGTPLLYPPRSQFREYSALEKALVHWPGGLQITHSDFLNLRWRDALRHLPARDTIPRLPAPGGPTAAQRIVDFYSGL